MVQAVVQAVVQRCGGCAAKAAAAAAAVAVAAAAVVGGLQPVCGLLAGACARGAAGHRCGSKAAVEVGWHGWAGCWGLPPHSHAQQHVCVHDAHNTC